MESSFDITVHSGLEGRLKRKALHLFLQRNGEVRDNRHPSVWPLSEERTISCKRTEMKKKKKVESD